MSRLTAATRNSIPSRDFALPGKRAYPIEDRSHARDALARVDEFGTAVEKAAVRHAVAIKYPGIKQSK